MGREPKQFSQRLLYPSFLHLLPTLGSLRSDKPLAVLVVGDYFTSLNWFT